MPALEFSDRLRRVLAAAHAEAMRLEHAHVGTEHLLLALLRDIEEPGAAISIAGAALDAIGVERGKMMRVLDETIVRGRASAQRDPSVAVPYTARAKAVIELAMAEARVLHHSGVGTEHLLLGLAREDRGIAAQVLMDHGVTADKARGEVERLTATRNA
jgi:ATP-dependent Clp protease ATP-binding subunit ClpC